MKKLNFEDWKKECKRIIYETTNKAENGVSKHNIECVDEWDWMFENGLSPKDAIQEAYDNTEE